MSGDQLDFHQGNKETLTGTLHDPAATTGHVLTVQADKSIKAAAGGGGSGGVQVVTVPVSSAQIKTLFTAPVTLVAGVAGNVVVVTGALAVYLAGATPYTYLGGTIAVAPAGTQDAWGEADTNAFWNQATSQTVSFTIEPTFSEALSAMDGVGAVLAADTANPTLGDGTLLVTLSYFLAPTV